MDAPLTLGAAGKARWEKVAGKYALRPDELSTLEDACALEDMIVALEEAWAGDGAPMTARGSTGQLVTHPLVAELRVTRLAKAALLRSLKLPDDAAPAVDASTAARKAANSRWSRGS